MILAIDPGPTQSAYVLWDGARVQDFGKLDNGAILNYIHSRPPAKTCVIEMIASYGMAVGAEVFETCVYIGRFMEAFGSWRTERLVRLRVKQHLCHNSRANDSNIRQALIDRFGGKEAAIGCKARPGPLYGIHADVWAALGVAVTWWDIHVRKVA